MTLLGGYLGSGKTTLINAALAQTDRPIAVLVNDVGAVNVDAKLLRRRGRNTLEFTDGCVCCSLAEGLGVALDQLRAMENPPDQVVLEMSGVADPARVIPWAHSAGFILDGVVVAADALHLESQLDHDVIGVSVRRQLDAADLIVITKGDLVDGATLERVRSRIEQSVPDVPILAADQLATGDVIALGARRTRDQPINPQPSLFDVHQTELHPLPTGLPRDQLYARLEALPADTVRAKAITRLDDGTIVSAQLVGRRIDIAPLLASEHGDTTDLIVIRVPDPTAPAP